MLIRTQDGSDRYPEVKALMITMDYIQSINLNGYLLEEHKKRDDNIELWLSGKLKVFQGVEDLEKYLSELQKEIDKSARLKYVC